MTIGAESIVVRAAQLADVDDLALIGVESFTATYESTTSPEDLVAHLNANFGVAAVRREIALPHCHYLVTYVDEEPAGLIKMREGTVPDPIPDHRAFEIQLLYIRPRHQRLGLGHRLIVAAREHASQRSASGLWLSAWEEADWALGFYRKVGFEEVGKQPFHVGQTAYADVIMWLPFSQSRPKKRQAFS